MIPNVDSLEEAIEHVKDPDLKEELVYQLGHYKEKVVNDVANDFQEQIDDLEGELEDVSEERDSLEDTANEYKEAGEKLSKIREILLDCVGGITPDDAKQYLNEVLAVLEEKPIRLEDGEEDFSGEGEIPF